MSDTHGVIQISGSEAAKLLQGQLTCDVEKLAPGAATWGAHCNPKGRIISLFQLYKSSATMFYFLLPRSMVAIELAALKKYAIFYKQLTLADQSELLDATSPAEDIIALRALIAKTYPYAAHQLPMVYPSTTEQFLPHELNLPALGAVSFEKGCYTGQEIIARMEYRGKTKKQLRSAQLNAATLATPGTTVLTQAKEPCGVVIDAHLDQQQQTLLLLLDDTELTSPLFIEGEPQALTLQAVPERNTP